ncbi:uncharacterized protein LOC141549495 [Sminthopsis crassicaudata]|uniref:uncharacterized protein LOC141549495 n=1 Tax=Sminthopsis crassicaudata TaxID=9301 RepID=UPI003D69B5C8
MAEPRPLPAPGRGREGGRAGRGGRGGGGGGGLSGPPTPRPRPKSPPGPLAGARAPEGGLTRPPGGDPSAAPAASAAAACASRPPLPPRAWRPPCRRRRSRSLLTAVAAAAAAAFAPIAAAATAAVVSQGGVTVPRRTRRIIDPRPTPRGGKCLSEIRDVTEIILFIYRDDLYRLITSGCEQIKPCSKYVKMSPNKNICVRFKRINIDQEINICLRRPPHTHIPS